MTPARVTALARIPADFEAILLEYELTRPRAMPDPTVFLMRVDDRFLAFGEDATTLADACGLAAVTLPGPGRRRTCMAAIGVDAVDSIIESLARAGIGYIVAAEIEEHQGARTPRAVIHCVEPRKVGGSLATERLALNWERRGFRFQNRMPAG